MLSYIYLEITYEQSPYLKPQNLNSIKFNTFSESISRLEYATERITYLEKKLKSQNADREEDCQKFLDIMGKSKECFKEIFNETKDLTTSYADTTFGTVDDDAESKIETQ